MKKPLQVLQVEDSESDAAMVVRLLSQAGYDVHHERVEDAEEMQAALDRQPWEVIIADFALPQFNAPSALALLQQTGLDIPFIVVSGTIGEELAVAMMKAGAHDYLMKDKLLRLVPAVEREIREAQTRRERRQAQAELQASEKRFRALIEHSADVVATLSADGVTLYTSPSVNRVLGYQPDELVGRNAFELVHPDHQAAAAKVLGQVLQQPGIPFSFEVRFRGKDGAWRWVDATGINLLDEPSVQAIVVNYRDVTERKQAEDALRESEEKYRNVVERANDGIVIIQDGLVKFVNQRLAEMWGGAVDEVMGTPFANYVHPDELAQVVERHQQRMAGEPVSPIYEAALRRKDGSKVYAEINAGVISYEGRLADLVIVRDITERKQAEVQLNLQLNELRRWHRATLGRETRILDLKREVNELLAQAGQPPRYSSAEDTTDPNSKKG